MRDIRALLASLAEKESPDGPALSFYRGRECQGRLSSGELLDAVRRFAGYLGGHLGVRPGDRVLILSPNRLEIPPLCLALLSLGAVVVPLNPGSEPSDWGYIARHSGARGIVAGSELLERFRMGAGAALDFELVDFELDIAPLDRASHGSVATRGYGEESSLAEELAVVLYTSGTTGNPKGVGLSQRNLIYNGMAMARRFGLEGSTQFAVLPLYHAHALGFGLMTSLVARGHLVFTDKLDPFSWSEIIARENVEVTSVVPSLLPILLAARVERSRVPSLRALLVSSAPLSAAAAREFEAKTGIRLTQGWGLSEYTNFACCLSPSIPEAAHRELLLESEIPSMGSPLEGTEVRVVSESGESLGPGEPGELWVRGPSRMIGYFQDDENTRQAITADGWLRTGDQGYFRMHEDQALFFVSGRIKEIIIRGGEKYSPLAIEKRLLALCPELEGRLVVLGFPHRVHGEEIGAYLELAGLGETADQLERLKAAIGSLPVELRPRVLLLGELQVPRTHTGKVQRRRLLPLFASHASCQGALRCERIDRPSAA